MKTSRIAVATAAIALTGILAGCASGPSAPPTESGPVTISFTGSDGPETYAPVIKAFEAKYPTITVKYNQIPQASFDSTLLQRLKAKDSSIDVFTVDQPTIAQFAASGVLSDMSSFSDEAKKAFPPDQYKVNFFRGKMWALPVWTSTSLLFYNKDALKAAGVDAPSSDPAHPITWQQLAEDAATVQQKTGIKSGFSFENPATYASLLPMAYSAGGGTGITGSSGLNSAVDTNGWKKAMNFYSGLFSSGVAPRGTGQLDTDTYFASGNAAYFVSGPWSVGGYLPGGWAEAKIDWGVAASPIWEGGKPATPTGAWSWSYNPASKHKDADLKFIEFAALNGSGNYDTVKATTIIPSNLAAAEKYFPSLEATAGSHGTGLAAMLTYQNDKTAVARPATVGYVQLETIMNKAIADIVNGSDVDSTLAQAQSDLTTALAALK